MAKHAHSIDSKILRRIRAMPSASVFSPFDFLDLGGRVAIDQALSRNSRAGLIRKIARGLYDRPRIDDDLGAIPPSADAVAAALARRDHIRIQPSGAHAANLLGLSTQVPVRAVFVTDGRSRTIALGKRKVVLRHVPARTMATAGRMSGTVMHALLWLGRRAANDDAVVETLRRRIAVADRRQLLKDLRYAPTWVAGVMRKVAEE